MSRPYTGKILLYGEYSILLQQKALATPLSSKTGHWAMNLAEDNRSLRNWHDDLLRAGEEEDYDLERFWQDLNLGLSFQSNIPMGYGVGSSGALVAAFYARYARHAIHFQNPHRFPELRKKLGALESYFHGNSSGTDPLVSYLNQSLQLHKEDIQTIDLPRAPEGYLFFLLDCGMSRQTSPLVQHFIRRMRTDSTYATAINQSYVAVIEQAIHSHCVGKFQDLQSIWQILSPMQLAYFAEMIPQGILPFWKTGNAEAHTYMKLCGAGGGGYMLGLSHLPLGDLTAFLKPFSVIPLPSLSAEEP